MTSLQLAISLPNLAPACANAALALFAVRRMGAHGLDDAHAAEAMLAGFGQQFRRPLVCARAFMADLSASATGPIAIASCCCRRMTAAEGALIGVLSRAEADPARAHLLLADLLGRRRADGVLASATAMALAFADEGRPIGGRLS